jgi:hypothetical protein
MQKARAEDRRIVRSVTGCFLQLCNAAWAGPAPSIRLNGAAPFGASESLTLTCNGTWATHGRSRWVHCPLCGCYSAVRGKYHLYSQLYSVFHTLCQPAPAGPFLGKLCKSGERCSQRCSRKAGPPDRPCHCEEFSSLDSGNREKRRQRGKTELSLDTIYS